MDALCCGSYKWLLAGFGVAPFFIRHELNDRIRLDRFGEFQIDRELPDHHFELAKTARRFDYCSRAFGPARELSAALSYLEKVGIARIEEHTVGLAHQLYEGLSKQGHRLFTPPGNRSSIVTMYVTKPMADVRAAFHAANVDVTVRESHRRQGIGARLYELVADHAAAIGASTLLTSPRSASASSRRPCTITTKSSA